MRSPPFAFIYTFTSAGVNGVDLSCKLAYNTVAGSTPDISPHRVTRVGVR